jgi:hypothetical protein
MKIQAYEEQIISESSSDRKGQMITLTHPGFPPTPLISVIPRARRPPKAPAAVAAEKKMAILKPHS